MNTITTKKLHALETIYYRLIYRDPLEHLALTRWLWRKLSAMYDALDLDF